MPDRQKVYYMFCESVTLTPRDGNLVTADALPSLAERFNLNHIVFVDGQR